MAQVGTDRNTIERSAKKRRDWFLTWNNYTPDNITQLTQSKSQYVFQEEIGEEKKTPHLQGYIKFENARTFKSIIEEFKGIHIEPPRKEFACRHYCQKLDTRNGKIYCNNPKWITNNNEFEKPKLKKNYSQEDLDKWKKEDLESWIKDINLSEIGIPEFFIQDIAKIAIKNCKK